MYSHKYDSRNDWSEDTYKYVFQPDITRRHPGSFSRMSLMANQKSN